RRSRRVRARVVSDDPIETIHGLDRVTLEPTVEIVTGGRRKERQEFSPHLHVEFSKTTAQTPCPEELWQSRPPIALHDVRRRLQHEIAEQIGYDLEPITIRVQAFRIPLGKLGDFLVRVAAAAPQVAAVLGGQEIRDQALDDPQPMLRQLQVAYHLR